MGLPISKKFAELMGGDVTVTSKEGEGSVFSIIVPIDAKSHQWEQCPKSATPIDDQVHQPSCDQIHLDA